MLGRLIVGFAVSLSATAECTYIAEISPPVRIQQSIVIDVNIHREFTRVPTDLLSPHSTTPTPTSSRRSSPTRPTRSIDFLKLFLWQAERGMSARMSVSVSWNADFTEHFTSQLSEPGLDVVCVCVCVCLCVCLLHVPHWTI